MYCICSNKTIDKIIDDQREVPLKFDEVLKSYTSCLTGCGSCIPEIRKSMAQEELLYETDLEVK